MDRLKLQAFLFRISWLSIVLLMAGCASKPTIEIHEEFGKYFDQCGVTGSFALFDWKNSRCILFNPDQYEQPIIPASTFKICNSLIGLETGVIPDENFIIQWDSIVHENENWNKDHDLKTAFKNSTVWYYQELARRVGVEKMKYWLETADYGNSDTTGGIGYFWLTGGLRISPKQQIEFLEKLHDGNLPFSRRSMEIVKKIMIAEEKPGWVLRAKTGWGYLDNQHYGWYVGWLETPENVYYFSNCIQVSGEAGDSFAIARREIVYKILNDMHLINDQELLN